MKKIYFLLALALCQSQAFAQKIIEETAVIKANGFGISRPLTEIFAENPVDETKWYGKTESGDRKNRKPQIFEFTPEKDGYAYGNDSTQIQKEMGIVPGEPTRVNVAGQTASGFRPYDPSGAVGPNHYIQMINSTTFRIYNKTTMAVQLTGTLGNLWSPATGNNGDPIVMYDKTADRWFLAQFGNSTDKRIYIAISTTNDPLGTYYTYTYTSAQFPDYLKFSIWADGYYMTSNQSTQKVFCFNRAEMLAGTPAARSVVVTFSPPKSGFFCPLPGDAGDGILPAYGTPCPIISYSDNGWGASYSDAVNIYQMAVNWVPTTPTATVTLNTALPTAAFDASYDPSWNDISQPGTTQKLDGIGGVCMYRAQWKSWAGYNTVVLNWGVKISSTQRSIKWCELRQNQSTGAWSIYQEGIYTPDAASRWMGSIAMDNNGSIGLSYLKSDATSIYPGLYYTGRRASDPLGTMPVSEVIAVAGTGYQTGTNRVGDYAHTTLDVDGITFWNTSEYMGGTSGGSAASTRIFSYQITPVGDNALVSIAQTVGTNPQCPNASATFTATPTNGGTSPSYQWKVNGVNVGTNSASYTSNTLTNGSIVTCVMTSNMPGVIGSPVTSSPIVMTVNSVTTPSASIALTAGTNPSCLGNSLTFTATPTNGGSTPTYQWKANGVNVGTNSATYTTAAWINGQVITCEITSSALCNTTPTATSNAITITSTSGGAPSVSILQTAGANPFCLGSSVTYTATVSNATAPIYQWKVNGSNVGTNSPTFTTNSLTNGQIVSCEVSVQPQCPFAATVGDIASTTFNGTNTNNGIAYASYYGNGRQQFLIRASELTALGFVAGNLTSIGFTINGTIGNPATLNGYTIKMAHTSATVLTTTFQTATATTVFGPQNYTPVVNTTSVHAFSTPFTWDGTSNVIVDVCFSNQVVGSIAYQNQQTNPGFVCNTVYRADNAGGAGACTIATGNTTSSLRPNMKFTAGGVATVISSNNITAVVTPATITPSINIALTSGSNPTCLDANLVFTATITNGGTTPSYQWKVDGVNAGSNGNAFATSSLTDGQVVTCTLISNENCVTANSVTSNAISISTIASVNPSVSISQSAGANPSCAGASVSFAATISNGINPSYQWKLDGNNVGTNSSSFTSAALTNNQVISCEVTVQNQCPTKGSVGGLLANATLNTTSSDAGVAYPSYYGNGRQQYLILASELQGAGLSAGNIGSMNFQINNTVGNPSTLNGYTIKLAATSASVLTSAFQAPTFTTVFGPVNYTPIVNSVNKHVFSNSFAWDGTSNVLVDICFSNQVIGTIAYQNYQSSTAFVSSIYYQADGASGANACAELSGTAVSVRPLMDFVINNAVSNVTSNPITMTVNPLPIVTANNATGCSGNPITLIGSPSGGTFSVPNPYTGPSTTFTYAYTNINGCTATTTPKNITVTPCSTTVQLKVFIEGYYVSTNLMKPVKFNQGIGANTSLVDDIVVELRNASTLVLAASTTVPLLTNGNATATFNLTSGNYYLVVKHKNTIPTWSANPITLNGTTVNYDFSDFSTKAFGSNMLAMGMKQWAFISGDIDQNGAIESGDYAIWETDANTFVSGYVDADLNGDGAVESGDFAIWESNSNTFAAEVSP